MITAGIAAFCGITVLLVVNDPAVATMMRPGQPMPDIALNLLLIAGGGYALWQKGWAVQRAKEMELEKVFGDG